jgi:hypothetical protein
MVGTTIEVFGNSAQCAGIGVDGFDAHTLKFKGPQMLMVQAVVAALLGCFHDKLLSVSNPG